jgi:hypothetical protein
MPVSRFALAIGKTLMAKMKQRGFAANDPRYSATLQATSVSLTEVAATAASVGGTVFLGAIGAPVWLTLLGSVAIGYGISLALDTDSPTIHGAIPPEKSPKIVINSGTLPTVIYTGKSAEQKPTPTPTPALLSENKYKIFLNDSIDSVWPAGIQAYFDAQADRTGKLNPYGSINTHYKFENLTVGQPKIISISPRFISQVFVTYDRTYCSNLDFPSTCETPIRNSIGAEFRYDEGPSIGDDEPEKVGTTQELGDGTIPVPQIVKDAPVNPELIAALADTAWQRAASQIGYQGVPYSYSDPVTRADVEQAYSIDNNPTFIQYPTVQDAMNPIQFGYPAVNLDPNTVVTPSNPNWPGTNPDNPSNPSNPDPDSQQDPSVPEPGLEAIPTPRQILEPILELLPSLRSFVVPQHVSECPQPSADIFNRHIVIDQHCALLDQVKPTLYAVMAFVWVLVAMFIVLGA